MEDIYCGELQQEVNSESALGMPKEKTHIVGGVCHEI